MSQNQNQDQDLQIHNERFVPKRTICLPIDSSENSNYTIDYVIKNIINQNDLDLIILIHCRKTSAFDFSNTIPFGFIPFGTLLPFENLNSIEASIRLNSLSILKNAAIKFNSNKIHVRAISIAGDPRHELVRKIIELNVDFVVLGSRGLGQIKKIVLGSVSTFLLNNLKIPVMVVPK